MISILLRFSYLVYLWLHDVLEHENFYDGFQNHVDGVFVQSDFHRGTLPTFLQEKTIVLPHGLDSNYPPLPLNDAVVNQQRDDKIEIINSNHIFIYASAPNRGLEYVLKLWPFIKEKISTAKLETELVLKRCNLITWFLYFRYNFSSALNKCGKSLFTGGGE